MNFPSRNVFVRPSTYLYDEGVSKASPKLPFRVPSPSTLAQSQGRHAVTLESPASYEPFREPAWKLFPPNFEHILALSKKDAKYKPVPRDVAETHMAMFHDYDEKMADEGSVRVFSLATFLCMLCLPSPPSPPRRTLSTTSHMAVQAKTVTPTSFPTP
jgi:hypothetical protein